MNQSISYIVRNLIPSITSSSSNVIALILFSLAFTVALSAQTISGTISGTVVDSTGAAVKGASVSIVSAQTAEVLSTRTSNSGGFVFSAIQPNAYNITVNMTGFKSYRIHGVILTAAEHLQLPVIRLTIGSVRVTVSVNGAATPIQLGTGERSDTLDNAQLEGLLDRSRDYVDLLSTLPGVVPSQPTVAVSNASKFPSMNGLPTGQITAAHNGLAGNDPSSPEYDLNHINLDAIKEVTVQMNNYQAQYGRGGSVIVNTVTKNGTQQFHGSVYDYVRNEAFNANDYFNNLNGIRRPRYRYQEMGWSIGGPVYIPKRFNISKNKLFFFVSQEILPQKTPDGLQFWTVPTALEREGNFSQTLNTNGTVIPITDPDTGQPFPGNIIPASQIDPNGQKILSFFPLPDATDRAVTLGNYNYTFLGNENTDFYEEAFRVDYNASPKLHLFYAMNFLNTTEKGPEAPAGIHIPGPVNSFYSTPTPSGLLDVRYTLSPTLVNEMSIGAFHRTEEGGAATSGDLSKVQRSTIGLGLSQIYPANNPLDVMPWLSFGSVLPNMASFSTDSRFPIAGSTTVFNFTDGLTKVLGAHLIKGGVFVERDRLFKGFNGGTYPGDFNFQQDPSNPGDTGFGFSNALLGNYDRYTESTTRPKEYYRGLLAEWYLQDTWQVTRKLTLDYGVRFTSYVLYHQADRVSQTAAFEPSQYDRSKAVQLYSPSDAPLPVEMGAIVPGSGDASNGIVLQAVAPKGFMNNDSPLVAPRIGFSYDPTGSGKMAIRGGVGIFYAPMGDGSTINGIFFNPPLQSTPTIYYGRLSGLLPANAAALAGSGTQFPSSVTGVDRDAKVPTSYQYSFGVQRELGYNFVLDAAYVGNIARFEPGSMSLNTVPYGADFLPQNTNTTLPLCPSYNPGCAHLPQTFYAPFPGYSSINYIVHDVNSNYNSLQVQLNRQFRSGFELGVSYTYSKAMADLGLPIYRPRASYYGLQGADHTHVLSISWLWKLPRISDNWGTSMVRGALNNWSINGLGTFMDGAPQSVGFNTDPSIDITGGGDYSRIDVVGNPTLSRGSRSRTRYFNTAAFAEPSLGSFGNAGTSSYRGPGVEEVDMAAVKTFPIKERAAVSFRWEMYNIANHPNWTSINNTATFNLEHQQINPQFGQATADWGPRVMQVALRVVF